MVRPNSGKGSGGSNTYICADVDEWWPGHPHASGRSSVEWLLRPFECREGGELLVKPTFLFLLAGTWQETLDGHLTSMPSEPAVNVADSCPA